VAQEMPRKEGSRYEKLVENVGKHTHGHNLNMYYDYLLPAQVK